MPLDKDETKQLLDRLIFEQTDPQDWAQDVWGLSPLMGESAARLFEVYEALVEACPPEKLAAVWESLYAQANEQFPQN